MNTLFSDLEREALVLSRERRMRATAKMVTLYRQYRGYVTVGLRCHFEKLIARSLERDPSARGLDEVVMEIAILLAGHKRRCDSAG